MFFPILSRLSPSKAQFLIKSLFFSRIIFLVIIFSCNDMIPLIVIY
ncbi:hypothetical protein D1AOALGA4SA_7687 [Olavius algarvensis Delta 1 endosymbiont]|nr:hypothetical protein D1AOALGA4SA_7687 [Olavius algarvensis Delta 1 endosymbiont]